MPTRHAPAVVALLLALVAPGSIRAQSGGLPPGTVPPDWSARPNPASMANVYPELANDLGLGGFARINCRINSLGLVESCHVLSQTPPAMGFGRAALRLAPMFRFRPATGLAGAIPSYVVIPVRFVPPPDDIRRAIPVMALLAAIATFAARRKRALTAKEEIGETGSIQA